MTGSGAWIIAYIAENGHRDVFQRDLEKEFDITRSTASKNVDLLVANDFITRKPVDYDARLKKLVLTEKAKEVFKIMRSDRATLEEQMLRGFSDEEKNITLDKDYIDIINNTTLSGNASISSCGYIVLK